MKKIVITYGTFDMFHVGHLRLLKRAKQLGDKLIVALSSDEFNLKEKNKVTAIPFHDRKEILESIIYVDEVIPENSWEQKIKDITDHNISIFVMGDDWKGKFDFLNDFCEVIYLNRTKNISSTDIKLHIKSNSRQQISAGDK